METFKQIIIERRGFPGGSDEKRGECGSDDKLLFQIASKIQIRDMWTLNCFDNGMGFNETWMITHSFDFRKEAYSVISSSRCD